MTEKVRQYTDSCLVGEKTIDQGEQPLNEKYREFFSTVHLRADLGRKAIRGGAAVMAAELGSNILRIGSITVLARLLLPEDFGLIAMVASLMVFAERFKELGLGDATVQKKEINHEQVSTLFWINILVCAGIALLLAGLSKTIAWFYQEPRLTAVSIVLASTFLLSGLVIQHHSLLRRQMRFGALAAIQLFSTGFSIVVAIVLAYYDFGYWALVARELSRNVFVLIATFLVCAWRPGLPKRNIGLGDFLFFGKNVTGYNMVHFFSRNFDKIIIGKLYGSFWVGIYANAYQLISVPVSQIQYPVNTVALPALSTLQGEPAEFRSHFEKLLRLMTFFSMPVVVFVALFADLVSNLLLGAKWTKAIPIFQVLAVGAFIEPVVYIVATALQAVGKTKEYFRLGLINAILFICCQGIGSLWGAIGVAAGVSSAVFLSLAVCLAYGLRHTPVKISSLLRGLAISSLCSLITALIMFGVRYAVGWTFPTPWVIPFLIGGAAIYIGVWLVVPGGRRQLSEYWDQIKGAIPGPRRQDRVAQR
ncbi:lipopolysaccharide biosynthesis protein [Syntrophobacter fumaroxidans]|uniref:lipopolysaccharide biosynthesis protein n=1 Tax=Syntrophobacter fumaroxidans TaxID=119484 RepID=UPI0002F2FDDF|nr:lipopolysaccharide biosynthesis protein [Syntrophobacter fumaroxidans]